MSDQKDGWRPIESAPKDGRVVDLKRVYNGRTIAEGPGLFGLLHADAPSLSPLGPDPLGRPVDYAAEREAGRRWVGSPKWLREDRLHAFPEPTHWRPIPPPPGDDT